MTGWVAFDQDLTSQRRVLDAMTATMVCRGPDAGGVHLTPHAALGHRRLAVIDIEGGRQPMTVEGGGRELVSITYTGEVYNHQELRTELESHGQRLRTRSDTEVVLRAYLQWGSGFVDRLNGMYAFAIWDARTEELLLVRDRMGVKPLFYHPTPDGVLFGSEPKAILAHPAVDAVVGVDGLRHIMGLVRRPGNVPYEGMDEVHPGHYVKVRREGLTTHQYWRLEAHEHTDDLQTTIATVRDLLEDTMRRQLVADVPLCSLLSGGLDSSAVTALAAQGLAAEGAGPVRSFSVDFVGQTANFQADDLRTTPDAPFAHLLAKHVGADHTDIVLDTAALIDRDNRSAVMRAREWPYAMGDLETSLHLLFRAIREHSTVALSGEAADELFGGYLWFHIPEAVAAPTFPWIPAATRVLAGPGAAPRESLLHPDLLASLDIAAFRADSYSQVLAAVPHVPTADPQERRMRELCYMHLTCLLLGMLDRKDRMSMATGLEVRVPFCDHRLVEYVFNTPWSMKTFDGREKSLLRAATRHLLPREITERAKSPYPATRDPRYPRALRGELRALAADSGAPVHALTDSAAVAAAMAPDTDPETHRMSTELLLDLNGWLSDYAISLKL